MRFIIPPVSSLDLITPELAVPATRRSVLGEIRRAHINGRLYPDPPREDVARNDALDELAGEGLIEPVPATATSLGGWLVVE